MGMAKFTIVLDTENLLASADHFSRVSLALSKIEEDGAFADWGAALAEIADEMRALFYGEPWDDDDDDDDDEEG